MTLPVPLVHSRGACQHAYYGGCSHAAQLLPRYSAATPQQLLSHLSNGRSNHLLPWSQVFMMRDAAGSTGRCPLAVMPPPLLHGDHHAPTACLWMASLPSQALPADKDLLDLCQRQRHPSSTSFHVFTRSCATRSSACRGRPPRPGWAGPRWRRAWCRWRRPWRRQTQWPP